MAKPNGIFIIESSFNFKKGKFLTEYKEVEGGVQIGEHFIPKNHYVQLNESLTAADEKRIKDIIRAQLKYMFWQMYTKQNYLVGNL